MRLFSLKAATIYLTVSVVLYSYEFVSLWGNYFEMATQKPVYPTFYYLNQTLLNPVNIFFEQYFILESMSLILIPILNILSLAIAIKNYKKGNKNTRSLSLTLIIIAIIPWLIYLYMRFFK